MPRGGNITIETGNVFLDESHGREPESVPPGNYVVLTVSDTGEGIQAEDLSRIFEPFFTTKESTKGRGLGLSVVSAIVKQNMGHIRVDSTERGGAQFKVYLPLAQPSDSVTDLKTPAGSDGHVKAASTTW
jgi:signal transduction histidine kinase